MELRQLRYFLKALELLNFTESARSLNVSQSSLSQQIIQLEEELGLPLFDRIGKKVYATEAGLQFSVYARQTLASVRDGRQIVQDLAGLKTGELVIGATPAMSALLVSTLTAFSGRYPNIRIKVTFGTSDELLEKLQASELDIALTFHENNWESTFSAKRLFDSSVMLVVSSTSPLADRKSIGFRKIGSLPLALPAKGYSTRPFIDTMLAELCPEAMVHIEINDISTLFRLVETGRWATVLTAATAHNQPLLKTIPIKAKNTRQSAWVVSLVDAYQKTAAVEFIKFLALQASSMH